MGKDETSQSTNSINQAEIDALLNLMDGNQTAQPNKSASIGGAVPTNEAASRIDQAELDALLKAGAGESSPGKSMKEFGANGKGNGNPDRVLSQDDIDALLAAMDTH